MVRVAKCSVDMVQSSPHIQALIDEYAGLAIVPDPQVQWDTYKMLESAGKLTVFGAFSDSDLIGFATVMDNVSLHYGKVITMTESLFVAQRYRKTGAGALLIRAIEKHAEDIGSARTMITAPHGTVLGRVLTGCGYQQSHEVYYK